VSAPLDTQAAASWIAAARRDKALVLPPDALRPADEDAAYAVQAALHAVEQAGGKGARIGYKIGCTTPIMQRAVGIDSPAYGGVLARNVFRGRGDFSFGDFHMPGIECEIAVRLERDLPTARAPFTRADIDNAVGACMAAIELVDNRYGDFKVCPAPVLIADDFFQVACVLGAEVSDWRTLDLAAAEGRTFVDGRLCGTGLGADVLGHPFAAVVWLANRLADRGESLKAGEFVLTGSLVSVQWIDKAPCNVAISIDGLGEVALGLA